MATAAGSWPNPSKDPSNCMPEAGIVFYRPRRTAVAAAGFYTDH
jgi:hypothetical protein